MIKCCYSHCKAVLGAACVNLFDFFSKIQSSSVHLCDLMWYHTVEHWSEELH